MSLNIGKAHWLSPNKNLCSILCRIDLMMHCMHIIKWDENAIKLYFWLLYMCVNWSVQLWLPICATL